MLYTKYCRVKSLSWNDFIGDTEGQQCDILGVSEATDSHSARSRSIIPHHLY